MYKIRATLTLFISLILVVPVWANERAEKDDFIDLVGRVIARCSFTVPETECVDTFHLRHFLEESLEVHPKYEKLFNISWDLSQIWGDTILEGGDFDTLGDTRLDLITEVKEGRRIVMYYVTYSEAAIDNATCTSDQSEPCVRGRIIESAFISRDLKINYIAPNDHARFVASPSL